jgi:hypothetical protein
VVATTTTRTSQKGRDDVMKDDFTAGFSHPMVAKWAFNTLLPFVTVE